MDYDLNFNNTSHKNSIDKIDYNQNSNIEKSNYAFLMEWHEYLSPKALNMLLENDIIVKAATKKFKLNGKEYDYGTILIPVQNNKQIDLNEFLIRVSKECLVEINSVKTGYADGPDLGSNNFKRIRKKNIALLVGDGINAYDAGEIWHLLDTRFKVELTKLDVRNIMRVDLSKYTT